ncbi:Putative membrane protein (plasmid) [Amycolatopsis japonica]|uniref:Putative membrane protein n=1 Tax=Amycolatopsis japonica TaxID=208439 RepID=A0A075VEI1_9PSEU|nr:hypothetical protein [Amycolatopsis japonica]AIG81320.1 Putative membrane protein [Amycolatopsis japonica]
MRKHALPAIAALAVTAALATITYLASGPDTFTALTAHPLGPIGVLFDEIRTGVINAITSLVTVYDAPGNAGVLVANLGGYEWRGTPGLFVCGGQC